MSKLIFDAVNTEGNHVTAFEFRDTEFRKGAKIVATDIVDLYDVEINTPSDSEVLTYDGTLEKWTNQPAVSGGCNLFYGYSGFMYVSSSGTSEGNGSSGSPFDTIENLFLWLTNTCAVVTPDITITILLLTDITVASEEHWNYEYGESFIIDGGGYSLIQNQYVGYTGYLINPDDLNTRGNIYIDKGHSLREIKNIGLEFYIYASGGGGTDYVYNYVLNFINIDRNSSTTFTDITMSINYQITPLEGGFRLSKATVSNNSVLFYTGHDIVVKNNSTLNAVGITIEPEHLILNGSIILTDDVSKFTYTTFTNSTLIEYQ